MVIQGIQSDRIESESIMSSLFPSTPSVSASRAAGDFQSMSSSHTGKSRSRGSTSIPQEQPKFRVSTQVGKKISKVRWLKTGHSGVIPDSLLPEYFVVGTWGEIDNEVSLWKLTVRGSRSNEDGTSEEITAVKRIPISGDLTDILPLRNDAFVLTTSRGAASIYKLSSAEVNGVNPRSFELSSTRNLHHSKRGRYPCPATGISILETSMVTVGEDGSIYELPLDSCAPIQSLEHVDEFSFRCVECIVGRTIATGNSAGQVKLWDLRHGGRKATQILNHLDDLSSATTIAAHPTQPHILLVGYSSGGTDLWDLRGSASEPIANLQRQDGGLCEISFHPLYPDNFYSCSQSGEVIHWFTAENFPESDLVQNNDYDTDLNLDFLKYGLGCRTLYSSSFPINSMDLSRNNRLICAGDSGILFCTDQKC